MGQQFHQNTVDDLCLRLFLKFKPMMPDTWGCRQSGGMVLHGIAAAAFIVCVVADVGPASSEWPVPKRMHTPRSAFVNPAGHLWGLDQVHPRGVSLRRPSLQLGLITSRRTSVASLCMGGAGQEDGLQLVNFAKKGQEAPAQDPQAGSQSKKVLDELSVASWWKHDPKHRVSPVSSLTASRT